MKNRNKKYNEKGTIGKVDRVRRFINQRCSSLVNVKLVLIGRAENLV